MTATAQGYTPSSHADEKPAHRSPTTPDGWMQADPSLTALGPNLLLPRYSAKAVLTMGQLTWVWVIVGVLALCLAWSTTGTAAVLILSANLGFLVSIVLKSLPLLARRPSLHDVQDLADPPEWPVVTVLCPMAREDQVCEQLVQSMSELDYPKDRLQVLYVVDADDTITLGALPTDLDSNMEVVLAVAAYPRCKPRGCNYAMWQARGDYVVIFDAEDRVSPDQVKAAMRLFHQNQTLGDDKMAVVQGRLLFDNDRASLLAGFFAIEYDQWHGLIVPALARFGLPVPLGGTSNYFRRDALEQVGGWDAYNVTEDADVGLRLFAAGWRTGTVPVITFEHAVEHVMPWIKQRSRWTKGYMMTALVHLRRPRELIRHMGFVNACAAIGLVGLTPALMAIAPVLWALLLVTLVAAPDWMPALFPGWTLAVAKVTFIAGPVQAVVMSLISVWPRRNARLIGLSLLFPVYGMLSSISAMLAAYEVLVSPHMWRKTSHAAG